MAGTFARCLVVNLTQKTVLSRGRRGWLYDPSTMGSSAPVCTTLQSSGRATPTVRPPFIALAFAMPPAETAAWIDADPGRIPPPSQTGHGFHHASDRVRRRPIHRRHAVIVGLLALGVVALTAARFTMHNAADVTRQHGLALPRLTAETLTVDPAGPLINRRQIVAVRRTYPTNQVDAIETTLLQQGKGSIPSAITFDVNGVAFSPDGNLLAGAYSDGAIRLWNPATGRLHGPVLQVGSGSPPSVTAVAFSPDGNLLAGAYSDGAIRLWNPATGRLHGPVLQVGSGSPPSMTAVAFSPDGNLLAGAYIDGAIRLWNPATGQLVGRPLPAGSSVFGVAFSPDGKLLASADADGKVRLWNPATGQPARAPLPAGSSVFGVAFSPDGKLLASADADGTVHLWNTATGQPARAPLPAGSSVNCVAFSPDGKLLASADADGTVHLWNTATGQPARAPLPAGSSVNCVAFSPDGKLLASADADGIIHQWNTATSQPVSPDTGGGFVLVASVIALVLSALVATITASEIWLARKILG